jgi:hypothetical protein
MASPSQAIVDGVASRVETDHRVRNTLIGGIVGVILAVVWSAQLVDDGIGQHAASAMLGHSAESTPISGLVAGALFAFVAGLAGTFTACNVAVFGAVAPLVGQQHGRARSIRASLSPIGWIVAGMLPVSAIYGAVGALLGDRIPQLSTASVGAMPVRLLQSIIVFGVIGLAMLYLGLTEARLVPDPLAKISARFPHARLVVLGMLVGGFLIGRPYPLFHKMFVFAADHHNPFYGALTFVLQSLGNMLVVSVAVVALALVGGGRVARWMTATPHRIASTSALAFTAGGAFLFVYWVIRLPAKFGYGWFPTMPWS